MSTIDVDFHTAAVPYSVTTSTSAAARAAHSGSGLASAAAQSDYIVLSSTVHSPMLSVTTATSEYSYTVDGEKARSGAGAGLGLSARQVHARALGGPSARASRAYRAQDWEATSARRVPRCRSSLVRQQGLGHGSTSRYSLHFNAIHDPATGIAAANVLSFCTFEIVGEALSPGQHT